MRRKNESAAEGHTFSQIARRDVIHPYSFRIFHIRHRSLACFYRIYESDVSLRQSALAACRSRSKRSKSHRRHMTYRELFRFLRCLSSGPRSDTSAARNNEGKSMSRRSLLITRPGNEPALGPRHTCFPFEDFRKQRSAAMGKCGRNGKEHEKGWLKVV